MCNLDVYLFLGNIIFNLDEPVKVHIIMHYSRRDFHISKWFIPLERGTESFGKRFFLLLDVY